MGKHRIVLHFAVEGVLDVLGQEFFLAGAGQNKVIQNVLHEFLAFAAGIFDINIVAFKFKASRFQFFGRFHAPIFFPGIFQNLGDKFRIGRIDPNDEIFLVNKFLHAFIKKLFQNGFFFGVGNPAGSDFNGVKGQLL